MNRFEVMTQHLTLFELNQVIKQTLDSQLAPSYWVIAEIGELRANQKGHCYLELIEKDNDTVVAKSRATIWSYTYRNLAPWFESMTGRSLQPGIKVLCNVTVQYHELYGFSLNIKDIDANFTLGERAKRRKEIIDQLIADGVFDLNKSHLLPQVPQSIAVISSPTAAGYGDFINQLTHNQGNYHFNIELFTAVVQGDDAPASIIDALHRIHQNLTKFDIVCMIRGGGSQIDLDCFDHYELAAHVAQFPLPVLTGIGHERDETITDMVAHTQLKTPTAVAEFLIHGMRIFDEKLEGYFAQVYQLATTQLQHYKQQIEQLQHSIKSGVKEQLRFNNLKLSHMAEKLQTQTRNALKGHRRQLEGLEKHLDLVDPFKLLEKGYTITQVNGQRINKVKIKEGDILETISYQQVIKSTINEIKDNE